MKKITKVSSRNMTCTKDRQEEKSSLEFMSNEFMLHQCDMVLDLKDLNIPTVKSTPIVSR